MKKTITSAGLLLLGAASLHAQSRVYAPAPGLSSTELSKPWSVSASLRGFYDDNIFNAPVNEEESFGFEFSPSVAVNWALPQTYIGLNYTYGLRWYEDRPGRDYDQIHQATAKLSHAFTEHHKLELSDSFVSAQEPEIITGVGGALIPFRSEGDNIRNSASAMFTADIADHFSTVLGYNNNYYDYDQNGTSSYSALLDRMEHMGIINLRWQATETTAALLGYQYGINDYTSKDLLSPLGTARGTDRDSTSHYVYVGADHAFTSQLQGSARVGAQFTDYDSYDASSVSPYADGSLTYSYSSGSYAMIGVRHARNATDVAFLSAVSPTLDQETTTVYGSLNHRITPKLVGSLLGQGQFSTFEEGAVNGDEELFFLAGVNLTYEINRYWAAEAGYNYDRLDSDIANRSFTRNRIYLGIRASY